MEYLDSEDMFPKNDVLYRMGMIISILFPISFFQCRSLDEQKHENKRKIRLTNKNIHPLLVLAGKCCVFTNVCNVYASNLAMLKTPTVDC